MSYVTSGQMDWLQMMYGDDTYQTMLSTFGRLVEEKVLPAEQNTEVNRAKNPLKDLKSILEDKGKFDKKTVDEAINEAKKGQKIPAEVYTQIAESGLTPAEELVAAYEGRWNGSICPVFQEYAY